MPFYCPICGKEMQATITQNFKDERDINNESVAKLSISMGCDHTPTNNSKPTEGKL